MKASDFGLKWPPPPSDAAKLDRLHDEFIEEFTVMGGGDVLDEIVPPETLWKWIIERFDIKKTT